MTPLDLLLTLLTWTAVLAACFVLLLVLAFAIAGTVAILRGLSRLFRHTPSDETPEVHR